MLSERTIPGFVALPVLLLLALALHAPILGLSFFSDDFSVIHRIGVQGDLGTGSFFRPLPDWTLWLNYLLAGPQPWAFRIVNIALLGVNGWLVFLLARRLMAAPSAFAAGVLFVLYPFHLEPQVWIIGRSTAMATLFTLAALVVATRERPTARHSWLVMGLGTLGALCYESALLLPLLLLFWWLLVRPADARTWRLMLLGTAAVVVVNLIARTFLTGAVANAYGTGFFDRPVLGYLGMACKVLGRSFLPPHADPGHQAARFGVLAVALLVILLLFWRANKDTLERRRLALLMTLFGISSLIAIVGGVSTRTSESDRFLYLPSAFLCIGAALVLRPTLTPGIRHAVFVLLALACGWALRQGFAHWVDASRTIDRIVSHTPAPPPNGRLLVWNLPGDLEGAFIFRHGYREALEFAGKDASRVRISPEGPGAIWEFLRSENGDTLHRNDNDRWFDANAVAR